jgi:hypothetical protein
MAIVQTLGEAYSAGWGIRVRCGRLERSGCFKQDPCRWEADLRMETLTATRGRGFPLARLASRLRCPNCGEMGVQVLFDVPGSSHS